MINLLSYIKRSSYRTKILQSLQAHPLYMPKELSKSTGIVINHVSNTLIELKQKQLIECVNEMDRMGRFYQLTPLGKQLLKEIGI